MRFTFSVFAFVLICSVNAQTKPKAAPAEQTKFNLEERVLRPATIPEDVLKVLRENSDFRTCDVEAGSRDNVPATWYEASQIHLDGLGETDLVVKAKNACMMGPNLGPFWVFRKTAEGHILVLSTDAVGVKILKSETNGLRDIRTGAVANLKPTYVIYKFDGRVYQAN
ncbi:MAG TPA: hypothetical protein VJO16_21310 [Candidatus Acidoferrum sp.]|nr:hypothetical protein [Candidatus Acidoferrum sp.]